MIAQVIVAIYAVVGSGLTIAVVERFALRAQGGNIPCWRRLLIALPPVLFFVGNLDAILSLNAFIESHPGTLPHRYPGNQAWNTDRLFYAALGAAFLVPFITVFPFLKSLRAVVPIWFAYFVWMMAVFCPVGLATGVPLQD